MADFIHRTQRDSRGYLLRAYSVNTPEYSQTDWLINPDLSGVSGVEEYYWKVTGTPPGGSVVEMDAGEKTAVDVTNLSTAKTNKKRLLVNAKTSYLDSRYLAEEQQSFNNMYAKGLRKKPNRMAYVEPYITWATEVDEELSNKLTDVDNALTVSEVNAIQLDTATLDAADPGLSVQSALATTDSNDLNTFLDANAEVTDPISTKKGGFHLMQTLMNRRELFNDAENPLYDASVTPILGSAGYLVDHASRINNVEVIHGKHAWHDCQVRMGYYKRPTDLLIYYGYPNSFNSGVNVWNNELVAQDMAKFGLVVLGNGVQDPSHPDYANTQIIIPRVMQLNPRTLIFGYVSLDQEITPFQTAVDQWDTLEVQGVFLDEAGYDFGRTRAEFNTRVDYVHGQTTANVCFANAWNTDNILGTTDDLSFPNSTFNPTLVESNLTQNDWILLESWPINTTAYSGNAGYESASDWYLRGQKIVSLRASYHVNFAGSCMIANGDASGQDLADFAFVSSLMYSLEGYGTSDTSYGAGATVTYWPRPDSTAMGVLWQLYPGVQQDVTDTDKYHRYAETGRMTLDFSTGAQVSAITKW